MARRVLLSGAELDLFTLLDKNPLTVEEIAAAAKTELRATEILLDALGALGLLVKKMDGTKPSNQLHLCYHPPRPIQFCPWSFTWRRYGRTGRKSPTLCLARPRQS